MPRSRSLNFFLVLIVWGLGIFFALRFGAVENLDWAAILDLRVPRVLLAAVVGAGLAVAGAVLQALFANPLCEPYTLGVSSGAALGAVIGSSTSWSSASAPFSAFLGSLIFIAFLYLLSLRKGVSGSSLLLVGVMLGYLGSSLVAVWMAVTDSSGISSALFWLLGDLSRAETQSSLVLLGVVSILIFLLFLSRRSLDAFLAGEEDAKAMGIDVRRVRPRILILSALLTGVCVSAAGMIGFVGLVVPHLARRLGSALHGSLILLSAILGAAALTWSDLLARMIARPLELPVGVVTALVGAPIFGWLIFRRGK